MTLLEVKTTNLYEQNFCSINIIKSLKENTVFSTLWTNIHVSIIVSKGRVVRYIPSCPRAELSGYRIYCRHIFMHPP